MNIRSRQMETEDLETVFNTYFGNQQGAQLAVWLLANDEVNVENVKNIVPYRNNQKKSQFQSRTFNYKNYRLRQSQEVDPDQIKQIQIQGGKKFIDQFKQQINEKLTELNGDFPGKLFLQTGIQEELNKILFNLKTGNQENGELTFPQPKAEYLKLLIVKIVEIFSKDPEEGVPEKIIAYGGVEPALANKIFSSDLSFKTKFKNILNNCKTFSQLKRYGGADITQERTKLTQAVSKCLISLKFDQKIAQEICDELLKNPLSNIVALRPDLTNKQKQNYYKSQFYSSGLLKKYAQIIEFENGLYYKVKQDVTTILQLIEDQAKNSKETVENVLNYNFYSLLKINSIKHIKKRIYQTVIAECPNFLKAFKLVKYQNKKASDLSENEAINQRIELASIFLEIKLPFEEWQEAQQKILAREYKVIDDLTLKQASRYKLIQHIFQKVEPSFHKNEKEMDYRSQIEHALLKDIMNTELENFTFDKIITIIGETLDSQNFTSEIAQQLGRAEQRVYNDVLKQNKEFLKYKSDNRKDIQEVEYQKTWELRRKIYDSNFEDKIEVSYESIDKFIQSVIEKSGKIPRSYPQYVTNLSKLSGEPIQPSKQDQEEEIIQEDSNKQIKPDPKSPVLQPPAPIVSKKSSAQLEEEFKAGVNAFVSKYISDNQDSQFEKCLNDKFGKDSIKYVKTVIETKAFQNPESDFFSSMGLNNLLKNRVKAEFTKNAAFAATHLNQLREILSQLNGSQGSSQSSPVKNQVNSAQLDEEFKAGVNAFVSKYVSSNQESNFEKYLNQKFERDSIKYVRTIIETKAFQNPDSSFFTSLGLNGLLTKRVKAEFATNSALALGSLKRCIEIVSQR